MAVVNKCYSVLFAVIVFLPPSSANGMAQFVPRRLGAEMMNGPHAIVHPVVYHQRERRQLASIHRSENDDPREDRITVSFTDHPFVLDVELNRELLPNGRLAMHHHRPGERIQPSETTLKLCHYQGRIRDMPQSWAAISTCNGVRGLIYDGNQTHYVEPLGESFNNSHLLIKHSDLPLMNGTTCSTPEELIDIRPTFEPQIRVKRQVTRSQYYVELAIIVDYKIYRRYDGNLHHISTLVLDIANTVNQIYSALNVIVVLTGMIVWSGGDYITIGKSPNKVINDLIGYNKKYLSSTGHDTVHLLTGFNHFGPVGIAWKNTICSTTGDSCGMVVNADHHLPAFTASAMAHEMGHNFGMDHDIDGCQCEDDQCVMTKVIKDNRPTKRWSSCSLQFIHSALQEHRCLLNKPKICGNMVVDGDEECDCGLPEYCSNPCCNPHTCRLNPNAKCARGACCDLKSCSWKRPGTECRAVKKDDGCDLPEYCIGHSPDCPGDLHKFNGASCSQQKNSQQVCLEGKCLSQGNDRRTSGCPVNCTSNGQCNNVGKCFCLSGYSWTTNCQTYGPGGSEDGGPANDPSGIPTFNVELYILFLAVFPIILYLFFCWYHNLNPEGKEYVITQIRICGSRLMKKLQHDNPSMQQLSRPANEEETEKVSKRIFGAWVKEKVQLKLPLVAGSAGSSLDDSPASGCSTATTLFSTTPDGLINNSQLRASPQIYSHAGKSVKKSPARPAPPPPPPAKPKPLLLQCPPVPPPSLSKPRLV